MLIGVDTKVLQVGNNLGAFAAGNRNFIPRAQFEKTSISFEERSHETKIDYMRLMHAHETMTLQKLVELFQRTCYQQLPSPKRAIGEVVPRVCERIGLLSES